MFTLQIWNEKEKLFYTIQRSYSSICDFHIKILKKFTRTKLPNLLLADLTKFQKRYEKSLEKHKYNLGPLLKNGSSNSRIKRSDGTEVISQKKNVLTSYLQELLNLPEVLMSEELSIFLDEESPNGIELIFDDISAINISLLAEDSCSATVSKTHQISIQGNENQVITW
jgi:hypothetical protein